MSAKPHVIERKDWADGQDAWKGELECGLLGADVSVIFNPITTDTPAVIHWKL